MRKLHSAGAKVAAEKLIARSNFSTVYIARAEARTHLIGFIGPAEQVAGKLTPRSGNPTRRG